MPNIFSKPIATPFQDTYTSQFVPLPLQQFARAQSKAEATQQQYEDLAGKSSDSLWDIKGVGSHDNAFLAQTKNTFDEAANQLVNKDLTQRDNQDAVKQLVTQVSRDKNLAHIMSNAAIAREHEKLKDEMMKAGTYQDYNDQFQHSLQDYEKSGGYKSGKNLDSTIHKYSEERPKMEEYFNNLGENGADILAKTGEVYYKNGWEGISSDRVNNRATQAFKSYLVTPEGQQAARRFNYMAATNPKLAKQFAGGANEYVFKEFLDAGLERVHGKSTSGLAAALNQDKKDKKEEQNLWAGVVNPETPGTLTNGRKFEFDDKGDLKGSGQGFVDSFRKNGWSWNTVSNWWNDESLNSEEAQDAKHIITGAKLNGVTPQQYAEVYDKTSHMKVKEPLSGKALRDNTQTLFNGGAGIWSHLNVMNTTTGDRNMNFIDAIQKLADKKGFDVPDPNKKPAEFTKLLKDMGVSITGAAEPNEFSLKPIIFTVGGNSFAADMTFGGTSSPFDMETKKGKEEYQKAVDRQNLDKLTKGQQVLETDSKGRQVLYYKDIKTGEIKHKLAKDL